MQHTQTVILTNWPAGSFIVEWYVPPTGASLGLTQAATTNGSLTLSLPDYTEDLAAVLYPPPRLTPLSVASTNGFRFRLDSETGGQYLVQKSFDLVNWTPFANVTNTTGVLLLTDPSSRTNPQSFFRVSK